MSFHSESSAKKWKFVIKRKIAHERELSGEELGSKDLVNLINVVGLMNIVTQIGPFFEKPLMKFIENISHE